VGARFSPPVQTGPGAHTASCTMGAESFPGVNSGRSVTLTPHPLLVLWSRKGRAIPLLPLWAVRPVQSLSACTRVHFTLLYSLPEISSHGRKRLPREEVDLQPAELSKRNCSVCQWTRWKEQSLKKCQLRRQWIQLTISTST
jgi:hypothetical protein